MGSISFSRIQTRTSVNCWALLKGDSSWIEKIRDLKPGKMELVYDDVDTSTEIFVQKVDGNDAKGSPLYVFLMKTSVSSGQYSDPFTID